MEIIIIIVIRQKHNVQIFIRNTAQANLFSSVQFNTTCVLVIDTSRLEYTV